eukprot:6480343-Amphidinium_carterae.1
MTPNPQDYPKPTQHRRANIAKLCAGRATPARHARQKRLNASQHPTRSFDVGWHFAAPDAPPERPWAAWEL